MKIKGFNFLPFTSCLLLLGCNSESSSTSNNIFIPTVTKEIKAYDRLATAPLNKKVTLDLSSQIDGEDVVLTGIYSDKPLKCPSNVESFLAVNLEITELGRCDYTYVAEDIFGQQAEAKITLVSSDVDNPVIPAFSVNLIKSYFEDQKEIIDLKTQLTNSIIPDGFILDGDSLTSYSELEQGSLKALKKETDLTFSFSAPTDIGWHKINYVLNNSSTKQTLIGEIFVSVADEINTPPKIKPTTYLYPEIANWNYQKKAYSIDVNLENLDCDANGENCLIEDENPWRVIDVKSMSFSDVELVNNATLFNKTFTLTSTRRGEHEVSYLVSDNEGATSMGMLRVSTDYIKPWKEAFSELDPNTPGVEYFFLAPLTYQEAKNLMGHEKHQEETIDGEKFLVSTWTREEAESLCATLSKNDENVTFTIPNLDNFNKIYEYDSTDNHIFEAVTKTWPKDKYYYLSDKNKVYDIEETDKNSNSIDEPQNYEGYVTCAACIVIKDSMAKNCHDIHSAELEELR